tara:strand:+ start:157 stop:495 length:339 start_codon:yes stop_codon:yes gene_type:complete
MDKAIELHNGIFGIPHNKQDNERNYLQMERGPLVLQIEDHTGRHQGGGPLHFEMMVSEEKFDRFLFKYKGGRFFTSGPYGDCGKNRALDMIDPDGNETEINTRYLYGVTQRA